MSTKRDIELLFEIGCLRYIDRIWKRFLNHDSSNLSEHIFRVVWIAITIAKYEKKVNLEKIILMALSHDIAESRTGDVDYLSRQYVERKEKDAIKDMLSGTVHEDKIELLEEYEKRESLEAKIVKDADTIDLALEVVENKYKGHSVGTIWNKNRQKYVYPTLFTKTAKKFWNEIHKANPHDWHLNGRNRFNAGDWKRK